MAKIIRVSSTTHTPHAAGQFKTSRAAVTNPFKYSDFEGNTLSVEAFADVFESRNQKINKFKLIASSVVGSVNKIRTGITEPIINFVRKIGGGISSAWDYAKNTNISDIGAIKSIKNIMNTEIHIPGIKAVGDKIGGIKEGITSKIGDINEGIHCLGNDISEKWAGMISKIHSGSKISADMSVADLEGLWRSEIQACEVGGAH